MIRSAVLVGLLCYLIFCVPCGLTNAWAQTSKSSVDKLIIAVLDVQQVLRRAGAANGIRVAMEARRKAFEEEIAKDRKRLQDAEC